MLKYKIPQIVTLTPDDSVLRTFYNNRCTGDRTEFITHKSFHRTCLLNYQCCIRISITD